MPSPVPSSVPSSPDLKGSMPHFVRVLRALLSELWVIYWAVYPETLSPEVDPLQLITLIRNRAGAHHPQREEGGPAV